MTKQERRTAQLTAKMHKSWVQFVDATMERTLGKDWQKAPADDVQVVNVYYERTYDANGQQRHYKDVLEGKDYYFWSPSQGFGVTDFVREIPDDVSTVKIGRLLPDGEWLKLYNKALNDHAW